MLLQPEGKWGQRWPVEGAARQVLRASEREPGLKYIDLRESGQDGSIERPELTSTHEHTRITTIYRETTEEKGQETSPRDLPQPKIRGRNHKTRSRESRDPAQARPRFPRGRPTNLRVMTTAEVLPKERGV